MKPACFGRYILVERIARGGMGEVFVAVTPSLWGAEKYFAVKKILPALSQDAEFLLRFRDEARLVIPMNHPNVVQVLEVGRVDDEYFIAMEYVEGIDLGQLLAQIARNSQQREFPLAAALYIVRELLAGLDYSHQRTDECGLNLGVVHRDVSPANVLVSYDGTVKLADFGLALSKLKAYNTRPNLVLGHWGYIAPEGLDGQRVDQRADIFCAGVLLFELLTCRRFAPAQDPVALRHLLESRSRTPPSQFRPGVPAEIDELVLRAVAVDPEARYPNARRFHDAVQQQLVRLNPFFGARQLSEQVIEPLLQPAAKRQRLRSLVRAMDLEEIEAQRPACRTVCLGEAIPLDTLPPRPHCAKHVPVLTFIGEVFEGDTEPMELGDEDLEDDEELSLSTPQRALLSLPTSEQRWLASVSSITGRRSCHKWGRSDSFSSCRSQRSQLQESWDSALEMKSRH